MEKEKSISLLKEKLYTVIFEAETPAGRLFDVILLWLILLSVAAVFLESIEKIKEGYGNILFTAEWIFTILFSIEYILRLISVYDNGICYYCSSNRYCYCRACRGGQERRRFKRNLPELSF